MVPFVDIMFSHPSYLAANITTVVISKTEELLPLILFWLLRSKVCFHNLSSRALNWLVWFIYIYCTF